MRSVVLLRPKLLVLAVSEDVSSRANIWREVIDDEGSRPADEGTDVQVDVVVFTWVRKAADEDEEVPATKYAVWF